MKRIIWLVIPLLVFTFSCDQSNTGEGTTSNDMTTLVDSTSYALGINIGSGFTNFNIKEPSFGLNSNIFLLSVKEALQKKARFNSNEVSAVIQQFQVQMQGGQVIGNNPANGDDEESIELDNFIDSVAYAFGVGNCDQFLNYKKEHESYGVSLDSDHFFQGVQDKVKNTLLFEESMLQGIMNRYSQSIQEKAMEVQNKKAEANRMEGAKFLAENKSKAGVKTTASGLQYLVKEAGTGPSPSPTDEVEVHYEGRLLNGEVFDSSIEKNRTITFALNGVIPGWTEGLQLMKEGAKYTFFIPSDLAYGPRGSGAQIGPDATLIFEVELIKVNP